MLVGLYLEIVALDRRDRTDRRAGRVDDLHADRGSGLSQSGNCGSGQGKRRECAEN